MIERARKRRVYDALQTAEITAWLNRNDDERYDVIAATDVLIYFGDLRQVVLPAARRLAPSGLIAFTLEWGNTHPFQLTDSGRLTHHCDHVVDVAVDAGLSVVGVDEGVLRNGYGNRVIGLIAVLRAAGAQGRRPGLMSSRYL